jgi:GGDEF domain-containing protein
MRRSLRRIDSSPARARRVHHAASGNERCGGRIVAERTRAIGLALIVKAGREGERRALPIKATVSVGVCDAPREGFTSAGELLAAARAALRRAESAGGDRVEVD